MVCGKRQEHNHPKLYGGLKWHLLTEVVIEEWDGVTLYKDCNFIEDDDSASLVLPENEKLQKVTASALLLLYEQESSIL